jgi:hypothetical protein
MFLHCERIMKCDGVHVTGLNETPLHTTCKSVANITARYATLYHLRVNQLQQARPTNM